MLKFIKLLRFVCCVTGEPGLQGDSGLPGERGEPGLTGPKGNRGYSIPVSKQSLPFFVVTKHFTCHSIYQEYICTYSANEQKSPVSASVSF